MTSLIRCRGSAAEIAALLGAEISAPLAWRPVTWPGEPVLVVFAQADRRVLTTMAWGLPADAFAKPTTRAGRGTLFARDLVADSSRLAAPTALTRCLVVLEAFAYPDGEPGRRTRSWAGLWDEPLCAWAGLCSPDARAPGCGGILAPANSLVARVSATMPLLLTPGDRAAWLEHSASLLGLSRHYEESDYFLEKSDESWARGTDLD